MIFTLLICLAYIYTVCTDQARVEETPKCESSQFLFDLNLETVVFPFLHVQITKDTPISNQPSLRGLLLVPLDRCPDSDITNK